MSAETGAFATVESDGFSVTSTHESAEQMTEGLTPEPTPEGASDDDGLSEAAAKLGEKGGKASAAKRAEQATGQPEAEKANDAPAANDADRKKGNPRHDPKARVMEATREAKEAREELARERAERERLSRELEAARKPAQETKPAEQPKQAEGKPKVEDFDKYEDFVEAVSDWKADQRVQKYQQETQAERQHAARAHVIDEAIKGYIGRVDEAKKADPSFVERTAPLVSSLQPTFLMAPNQPIGPLNIVADEIIKSAQSAALLAHFSDNPDALSALESLPTIPDIQAEIRFLAKSLTAAPQPSASRPEISKARPPVRPVTGAPASSAEPDPDSSSFDDHLQFYNSKEKRR